MKKLLAITLMAFAATTFASSGSDDLIYEMPKTNLRDKGSLQRGAKYFMNYCSGCHSLDYMRYSQMAKGIGLTDAEGKVMDGVVKANLMFSGDKVGGLMHSSMTKPQAKEWFGTKAPDLTLVTRYRKPEWVYNYLLSFYPDESRPWGTNNALFEDVAMPNVLSHLQGIQMPIREVVGYDADHRPIQKIVGFEQVKAGQATPEEFRAAMYDLTNFLTFAGDPKKLQRERVGVFVLLFLVVFTFVAYLLKREYWKSVD